MNCKTPFLLVTFSLWASLLLAGCGGGAPLAVAADEGTPTIHPYFDWGSASPVGVTHTPLPDNPDATPTVFRYFDNTELPTPLPTNTRRPTPTPRPTETPLPTATAVPGSTHSPDDESSTDAPVAGGAYLIFGDELDSNWTLAESWDVEYDIASTDQIHTGDHALAVTPSDAFGALFFAVDPETDQEFLYADVLGVSFWVNPGEQELALEDMAVTVLGSNEYAYWRADDTSVANGSGEGGFSETRLYYLDFNRSLPAGQWNEVVVWLNDLIYDPQTVYLTGVYIKNGESFTGTYYIDDVTLITQGE